MSRELTDVVEEVAGDLYLKALKVLPPDVKEAVRRAYERETNAGAKGILQAILKNIDVAERADTLVCQDTGIPVYMMKVGSFFPLDGATLIDLVRKGCMNATLKNSLRPSIVHPLTRVNTKTNVGYKIPVAYIDYVPGLDYLEVMMLPKGSGSENMSYMKMLVPADGVAGIKKFVMESIVESGGNPCPPTIVGVGIGGSFDLCARLAKEAIARPVGSHHPDPAVAKLEEELLDMLNRTGIGPMGLGGDTTALSVQIETADTHMTMLPVSVNAQCWRGERAGARIRSDGSWEYIWDFALGKEGGANGP